MLRQSVTTTPSRSPRPTATAPLFHVAAMERWRVRKELVHRTIGTRRKAAVVPRRVVPLLQKWNGRNPIDAIPASRVRLDKTDPPPVAALTPLAKMSVAAVAAAHRAVAQERVCAVQPVLPDAHLQVPEPVFVKHRDVPPPAVAALDPVPALVHLPAAAVCHDPVLPAAAAAPAVAAPAAAAAPAVAAPAAAAAPAVAADPVLQDRQALLVVRAAVQAADDGKQMIMEYHKRCQPDRSMICVRNI